MCKLLLLLVALFSVWRRHCNLRAVRTIWCKQRSRHSWTTIESGAFGEQWWKENLRLTKETSFVCEKLHPFIENWYLVFCVGIYSLYMCIQVILFQFSVSMEGEWQEVGYQD